MPYGTFLGERQPYIFSTLHILTGLCPKIEFKAYSEYYVNISIFGFSRRVTERKTTSDWLQLTERTILTGRITRRPHCIQNEGSCDNEVTEFIFPEELKQENVRPEKGINEWLKRN